MAIIKCKMCGGDIEISADKTFGTCEYCGSTMTLPKTDDDQRLSLFNRGTHLRRNGEFDKAAAIYERLIGENDADAEAHWNLLLCRYGIEYVQDPASGERIPTCHRASFDSILNDVDYQAALKYSDGVARSLYEKEAQRIAALQKDILAISQKETPFDVFICYKESDENGKRTKDSALAQDIYYQLTDAGYKVFFARITLEDKLGQEYEPYIFAALHSAKVMVVVGTKPEYLNAVWVKNEWSRYLALMRTDRSRLLIPCYRDMDPYDMPEELSMLQSQDMGRIGFIQDLIRGVKKVVDAAKPQEAAAETVKETVVVHNETSGNVQALLKRGNMALEDGEWGKADEFFEQVLNQDAECGAAYLGKFLASKKSKNAQDFVQSYLSTVEASAPTAKNAEACSEDSDFIQSCVEKYTIPGYLEKEEILKDFVYDRFFCSNRSAYFHNAVSQAEALLNNDKNFKRAEKYASADARELCSVLRSGLINTLYMQETESTEEAAAEQEHITASYHTFLQNTEKSVAATYAECLAKKQADDAKKEQQRIEWEKKAIEEAEKEAKQKKVRIIIGGVAAAVVTIVLVITQVIIPSINYSKAAELRAAGDYDAAIAMYAELGNFKNSVDLKAQTEAEKQELLNAQTYADAETLLRNNDFDGAIAGFESISGYKDAVERALDARYQKADSLQSTGNDKVAAIAFGQLGAYKDSRTRSVTLWNVSVTHPTIVAGRHHTVGIRADGTVVAVGKNDDGQCETSSFSDIIAVAAGDFHTVGLKADGTAVGCSKRTPSPQSNVSSWEDIVSITANGVQTIGLKIDGTVLGAGKSNLGLLNVYSWENIVAISAGATHTVGLTANGKVVAVGSYSDGQLEVSEWDNIIAIAGGGRHTAGLCSNGTVVAAGNNAYGQCDVSDWTDIVDISAGYSHTIGLKADGTVVAVGNNDDGQCNVSDWTDIVEISAGLYHTVGLKADGTVVATGNNDYGQCDVSGWTNVKLPN